MLKTGRRYKPPRLSPCLTVNGRTVEDPQEVKLELGRFFATAEKAQEVDFVDVIGCGTAPSSDDSVDIAGFPTVAEVAEAFARMKGRRAPGLSGLPADVFKACPVAAAHLHMPVYLKILARGIPQLCGEVAWWLRCRSQGSR